MKKLLLNTLMLLPISALTQNPIITDQFSADPTARVFDGRMYVYPSHDIPSPIERLKEWFCMADYHVFSSSNLSQWTDHGAILSQNNVPWVDSTSYSMWAPDCIEKNGKYYFFFPAQGKAEGERKPFGIGVAEATHPYGPFTPRPKPIEGIMGIDPCVLQASDGKTYIYWAGGMIWLAELNDDFTAIKGKPQKADGLPNGFKEGPFAFERNGLFYLTFPWVEDSTETLAYATSKNPMGPFDFKGKIMEQWSNGCWTNHHSIVEMDNQWYIFYHHNDLSPKFDKNRSICADSLRFNPDGTIQLVTPTLRGIGISNAHEKIQIDRYSKISNTGAKIDFVDSLNTFSGWQLLLCEKEAWAQYNKVEISKDVDNIFIKLKSQNGAKIELKLGTYTITLNIAKTNEWTTSRFNIPTPPKGVMDIKLKLISGTVDIDWISFSNQQALQPFEHGAFQTHKYRNLFAEAGYTEAEIDNKLNTTFNNLFFGPNRIYFEVGDSLGYISDLKNNDVRTEGMSYGMMIAVQMDRKDIFDRIWRWSKKYMQHQSGPMEGYFAWSCKTDGTRNAMGPASDGELYYITSLLFASNKWGNNTGINYLAEAQHILKCCAPRQVEFNFGGQTHQQTLSLIDPQTHLISFVPGMPFTDPSYHLPAFYEVWAKYAHDGKAEYWLQCAQASREYLHHSVDALTGLCPDYNNFDGSKMNTGRILGDVFRFDSWRVPMNIALDYSWSCSDKQWQQQYGERIQNFLYSQGIDTFVDQYETDGTQPTEILEAGGYKTLRHSLGLVATSAAISLVCQHSKSHEFIQQLWNAKHQPYADGYFDAYYDGLLHLFALMHLSGRYRIIEN